MKDGIYRTYRRFNGGCYLEILFVQAYGGGNEMDRIAVQRKLKANFSGTYIRAKKKSLNTATLMQGYIN